MSRQLPIVYDTWNPLQSELLRAALIDFLPAKRPTDEAEPSFPLERFPSPTLLQPGFHLVYFPPASTESQLLPDGTDPLQSPGPPYVRRMWAGGSIHFKQRDRIVGLKGKPVACLERITDAVAKGTAGEEKIFINLERRMGGILGEKIYLRTASKLAAQRDPQQIRELLSKDENCNVIEHRSIVFMQERPAKVPQIEGEQVPNKILKPTLTPHFTHTLVPSPTLLYRFSGLTFNAHRIHLDKQYCQQIEQHRGLLVHGPLSLVIMMQVVKQHLSNSNDGAILRTLQQIDSIEYKNLAPLYAEEPMTVCVCKTGDAKLEVWIQGPDGGIAVRGVVRIKPPKAAKGPSESAESTNSKGSAKPTDLEGSPKSTKSDESVDSKKSKKSGGSESSKREQVERTIARTEEGD